MMRNGITDAQWSRFKEQGYVRLGPVLEPEDLAAMQRRIDEIMMGTADVPYDRMLMQLDSVPGVSDQPGPQSKGHKLATLSYRKIQDLEFDVLFLRYMQRPLFKHICERAYGLGTPVSSYRAMFMNKPAHEGTDLAWHQDRWTSLDRDPLITIWTALDPATVENGCMWVTPGRHNELINPSDGSGFLTEAQVEDLTEAFETEPLTLEAGEVLLLHNHLPHRSGVNSTDIARRAFSVCYMETATVSTESRDYPVLFGPDAMNPDDL
ncbi:MAG: phytanoyl-CoA dioxygenase family protein [Caldilineaceae bacterium SB0665_bin_21]|nr:phytanoyl-CoA dioxygenase family protein [Caldilineaceae bacterium SB0665_bin_21]MYA04714.1 phytanoyl-CoA dioxygenase family protein [Caldilineaceae bacterium SB0664_bin_22]MYC63486.1 phytanoyl-CoA dioxygenase family protein [Caldilineaceae bacterium SB0661_bin_34]